MNQNITIADLKPSTRGSYLLRFEVIDIISNEANSDEITCKLADESGCVNAYFSAHGKHIKIGHVYQLQGLRCKVIDHHLRLELLKQSKMSRVKYEMAFKDLVNDMSEKFYVSKAVQESMQAKVEQKQVKSSNGNQKEKSQQQKNSKISEVPKKQQSPKQQSLKKDEDGPKHNKNHQTKQKEGKKKYELKNPKEAIKSDKQQKPYKKKYVAKKQEDSDQRVMLKDIDIFREKDVNLFVQIYTKTTITANKYLLVKGADASGSTYLEFDRRSQLEDKTWYCLRRFKVFADKKYGFIASQQEYSTFDILDDFDERPERSPIDFPNPK